MKERNRMKEKQTERKKDLVNGRIKLCKNANNLDHLFLIAWIKSHVYGSFTSHRTEYDTELLLP